MYASVENWKLAEIFFAKDRMAPEEILRILGNAISPVKPTKKPQEFVWKIMEKHMKIHDMKLDQDKYSSLCRMNRLQLSIGEWLRDHETTCFFMIAKPVADR